MKPESRTVRAKKPNGSRLRWNNNAKIVKAVFELKNTKKKEAL
jgi:hypothetical protein